MKSFREYLLETKQAKENKVKGTYASLDVESKNGNKLFDWVKKECGDANLADPTEYHCTVIYSRKDVKEVENWEVFLPIKATPIGWEIFSTQDKKKCLVLKIRSNEINDIHFKAEKELDATWDYPEYIPHITICAEYENEEVPNKLPKFKIILDKFTVTELDLERKIKTVDDVT